MCLVESVLHAQFVGENINCVQGCVIQNILKYLCVNLYFYFYLSTVEDINWV